MMREKLTIIALCVSLVVMIYFLSPSVIELCFSHVGLYGVRAFWPFAVAALACRYVLLLCRKHKRSSEWALWTFVVVSWVFRVPTDNLYLAARNEELSDSTYLISTGKKFAAYREPGTPRGMTGRLINDFFSFQIGFHQSAEAMGEEADYSDTVLLKISRKHNFQRVVDFFPTHAEIQKYMEPVLFVDGVEQPRPEYDDLRLSDEEQQRLLQEHHLKTARVTRKHKDEFLRNLVTLQINDTIQRTLNLMYKDVSDFLVYKDIRNFDDIFNSLTEGGYVLVKVSHGDPRVIEVADWLPTDEMIEKHTYYMTIATVMSKCTKKEGKHRAYYAKLRINDRLVTNDLRIIGIYQGDRQEYESLEIGGPVLVTVHGDKTKHVSVHKWHPTQRDIERYGRSSKLEGGE